MVFSSTIFIFVFLPLVLALYAAAPKSARNAVLLLASLFFYAWGELAYVLVMLASTAANYGFGLWVAAAQAKSRQRRIRLGLATAANLGLLIYFKYANFLAANFNALLEAAGHEPLLFPATHLPLGISFFTFQAMSYVVDVARGTAKVQRNPANIALYIALFPQLIAGPIVRYQDVADQIRCRATTLDLFASGTRLFLIGMAKKVLVANPLGEQADVIFATHALNLPASVAWLGLFLFFLQLYFDFSGYSDMAIGLGRMFGFRFLPNFNYPYISKSLTEFWQRWHISLSTWFRDYLFLPLGGYRCSKLRSYLNLLIVFTLCGLWHGASWNFLIFGLYQGVFLIIERLVRIRKIRWLQFPLGNIYFLFALMTSMVFFRANDLKHAIDFFQALFGFGDPIPLEHQVAAYFTPELLLILCCAVLGSLPILPWLQKRAAALDARLPALIPARQILILLALCGVFVWSAAKLAAGTHNPFIYFRF